MQRTFKNLLCVLALIAVAQAASTEQLSNMFTQLKSESLMETPFGKDLMFMMEMKGPAVDSIVNLLDGLRANVVEK
jgi:hypothetical protein